MDIHLAVGQNHQTEKGPDTMVSLDRSLHGGPGSKTETVTALAGGQWNPFVD